VHYHLFGPELHVIFAFESGLFNFFISGSTSFGAWINMDAALNFEYEKFEAAKHQGKIEKPRPSMPIRGGWY
jgi:hypothetical protein